MIETFNLILSSLVGVLGMLLYFSRLDLWEAKQLNKISEDRIVEQRVTMDLLRVKLAEQSYNNSMKRK